MASAQSIPARARFREASAERVSLWRTPRTRALLLLGTLGLIGAVVAVVARFYTDLLWFNELGLAPVYLSTLKWKLLAGGAAGLGTTCFLLLNFAVVERAIAPVGEPARGGPVAAALRQGRRQIYPIVAIAGGIVSLQSRPRDTWQLLALWANRTDFGVADPVFHRDVGYYVFSLPLYHQVASWLLETALMASAATLAAYAVLGGPGLRRWLATARAARAHLLALGALVLLIVAWRIRLDQLGLVLPHGGSRVPGASYTDIHIVSPALVVLALMAVAGAMLCLYAIMQRVPLTPVVAVGLVAAGALVGKSELPALVEQFDVQPQELSRERPQLSHAIEFTRRALALDRVRVRSLPVGPTLSAENIRENRRTLDNVQLWDAGVLRPALNDLQSIGQYYGFPSVTVDRYMVDGEPKVLTVAARQLDRRRLGPDGRGWATARFGYTHGYGVVAVGAAGTDPARRPSFVQQAFSRRPNPLGIREPRIYYGEGQDSSPPYVVVNSRRGEIDAPTPGSRAPDYHYDGPGGIPLSSSLRRIAFAARFADLKLLLTQTATERSRVVMHQNARERLATLAPFLRWDPEPQTAVVDGRVQFVFHGYTTSGDHPYAAPFRMGRDTVNYVRAGAVAAVDAFSGRVRLYVGDPGDPIMHAWQRAFPGLFQAASRMPEALRARLRYPEQLFAVQVAAYATYHADDTTAFWNGTDAWQRPQQLAGPVEVAGEIRFPDPGQGVDNDQRGEGKVTPRHWALQPEYLLARFPGEHRERFMLATPFTPRSGQNLVAYFAGSLDHHDRPRLTLLSLPRDKLTLGPTQATRRILASPEVNRRLDLLNRESRDLGDAAVNRTILGAPRTVPVAGTVVYVQPIYLAAGGGGVPRLQMVTVLANGRVGYGRTLRAALRRTV